MYEKIFGLGLNKTGTTTLGQCMKQLGFRHLSCRRDLLVAYRENRLDDVFAVTDAYQSFDDWPYPLMYRELFERYGNKAGFILTTRSTAEGWVESLKYHSLRTDPDGHCRFLAYGFNYPHGAEQQHVDFYNEHNRSVRQFFEERNASSRLLNVCWEKGDGWAQLCAFLSAPIPRAEFPHANKKREIKNNARLSENTRRIERQQEQLRGTSGAAK